MLGLGWLNWLWRNSVFNGRLDCRNLPPTRISEPERCDARRVTKTGQEYWVVKWSDDDQLPWWQYKGKPLDRKQIGRNFGFVYCINFKSGKKYVGRKNFGMDWEDYVGSGDRVKQMVEKKSKASLVESREILSLHKDASELMNAEKDMLIRLDAGADPVYLNKNSWYKKKKSVEPEKDMDGFSFVFSFSWKKGFGLRMVKGAV